MKEVFKISVGIIFSASLLATQSAFASSSCEGINLNRSYKVIGGWELSDKYLKSDTSIQLMRLGDDQDCSFRAKATVEERTIEYSIPPPPGVIVGAYDMCALWAFDEISRPRSFPKDMIEVCKVWQNRPPDREVVKVFNIQSQLSSEEVRLDRSRQVSDIADCRVR